MQYIRISNNCATCGIPLQPFSQSTFTAHEFHCYKSHPNKIPDRDKLYFQNELKGEQRSLAAKKGVETRRKNGGKRAPRPLPQHRPN